MSQPQTPAPRPAARDLARQKRFGAYLMLTVGALVTLLCGGCTGAFLIVGLASGSPSEALAFAPVPRILGGLPTAAGVFLVVQGLRALRDARNLSRRAAADTFE